MAKLHHIRQLAVEIEATPGTHETIQTAGDLIRVRELTLEQNAQYFDRPIHTRSFGYTPRRQENSMCELTFAVEIAGHTDNAGNFSSPSSPTWGRLLRACGFTEAAVNNVTVSSGTITGGPIQNGETISATGSGLSAGTYYTQSGAFDIPLVAASGTLSGSASATTSGASFTVGANDGTSQSGYVWFPDTASETTVSISLYNNGDRIRVYGCRGDVTIDLQSQDIALLRFTMMGIYSDSTVAGPLDDLASAAYPEQIPPTFVDASLSLKDTTGSNDWDVTDLNFTEAQFTLGNNVVMRQNSNSSSGWLAAHIANRTPNGRFNPDDPGVGTFDVRDLYAAQTRWTLETQWGSTVGNTFKVQAAHIELDTVGDGERDEVQSLDMSFRCTRGFESGANKTTVGDDNELLLFNF